VRKIDKLCEEGKVFIDGEEVQRSFNFTVSTFK